MSGSGGIAPLLGRGAGQTTACDELRFEANLASPVEEVVEHLYVGAQLDVSLEDQDGPRVVVWFEQEAAGAIIDRLSDLIRCLQTGKLFHAIVRFLDDGIVRVEVQPA